MRVGIFIISIFYWTIGPCSGGELKCSDLCASGTCCEKTLGNFLCCPVEHGVCCSGADTCCPQGSTCNADGSCTAMSAGLDSNRPSAGILTTPSANIVSSTTPVVPSPSKECDSLATPCASKSRGVACCPFENAICCNDGLHCCPAGYKCDARTQSCILSADNTQLGLKVKPKETPKKDNTCPVEEDTCDEWQTCCKMADGRPGCCPLANAECCADGEHCCPEGTHCSPLSNACIPSHRVNPFRLPSTTSAPRRLPIRTETPAPARSSSNSSDSLCPDGKSHCREDDTCCLMVDKTYGCCPSKNAVCCADGEHCCPSGYKCNNVAGTCVLGSAEQPLLKTDTASLGSTAILPAGLGENKCDATYACGDKETCCRMEDGNWGCCPLPKAVCCDDKKHCCPEGYACLKGSCKKKLPWASGPAFLPMKEKKPARLSARDAYVPCPDGHSKCPDGSTCCPNAAETQYGCCPIPNAVCCSDGVHCCPRGFQCDVAHEGCLLAAGAGGVDQAAAAVTSQNWFNKILGRFEQPRSGQEQKEDAKEKEEEEERMITCADGKSKCPAGALCCPSKMPTGDSFACCPFADGHCCADGGHCCPRGYSCGKDACVLDLAETQPWDSVKKTRADDLRLCPDGLTVCSAGQHCCRGDFGANSWKCCP